METKQLRPEQIRALQAVRDAGGGGYAATTFTGLAPFAFTLAILNRSHPELLTGFPKDEDPAGFRVTLTERGLVELAKLEGSSGPNGEGRTTRPRIARVAHATIEPSHSAAPNALDPRISAA